MKLFYANVSGSILNVKLDKRTDVYKFGKDNAFPSLVEALINMSVTAKNCTDRVAKAIYGGSFGDKGKVVVNAKGETLNEVFRNSVRQYSKHNNAFIHIGYDANFDYSSVDVIPVTYGRIGHADDKGYSGKIVVYNNWDRSEGKVVSRSFIKAHRFSKNKLIVEKQVAATKGGIQSYYGQIIHIKKESAFVYALTDYNTVLGEMLLEHNSQTFRSRGASRGFLNAKLLVTQPFKDSTARDVFYEELDSVSGAENSSEVIHLEAQQVTDDLDKQFKLVDLSSEYNDKLFEYSDKRAENNICKAGSVPLILVTPSDSNLFGDSGVVLKEAKLQLWESRLEDRNQFEEVFNEIADGFAKPIEKLEIVNPYEVKVDELVDEPEDVNAKAQATLRGSVGGVTSLLLIQQGVSAGTTTKGAGVAMIVNLYGFTEEQAEAMLGDPKLIKPEE